MESREIPAQHSGEAVRVNDLPEGVSATHEDGDMEQKVQDLQGVGAEPRGETVPHDIHNPTVDVGNMPEKKETNKKLSFFSRVKKFLKRRYSSDVNEIVAQKSTQRTAHFDELRKRDAAKKKSHFETQQNNGEVTQAPHVQIPASRHDAEQIKVDNASVQDEQAAGTESHNMEQQSTDTSSTSTPQDVGEQKRNDMNTNYQQNST